MNEDLQRRRGSQAEHAGVSQRHSNKDLRWGGGHRGDLGARVQPQLWGTGALLMSP